MNIITNIEIQKNSKNRFNVYIDDKFYCVLDDFTILSNRLEVGQQVDTPQLQNFQHQGQSNLAFNKAIAYVSRQLRCKAQLKNYLKQHGFVDEIVEYTVDKIQEYGYINDGNFAKEYIIAKRKKYGMNKIFYELNQLGIDDSVLSDFKNEHYNQDEEVLALAQKYIKIQKSFDKQKLIRHLMSKGFSYSVIDKAIIKLLQDERD